MKLHYNSENASVATIRKLKSAIAATDAKVEEVTYKTGDDVSKVSFFNTLPILETPEGSFFSSNTILRYLASSHKSVLYCADNQHNQALVDQWLDFTACEFEATSRSIMRQVNGEKIDFGKLMEDVNKFLAIVEKHLAEKKFLVADTLTIADLSLASAVSVVFSVMFGEGQRKKYANTVNWYTAIAAGNAEVGPKDLPKEAHEAFKGGKKGGKKEEKKEDAKKPAADEDDLFGDDDTPAPVAPPKPKKETKKKEKPAAKSIVVFDVKVYDQETNLQELFAKIKTIEMDGLVWNAEPKILPVAFGMNKLQVGCVVEDEKVSTEDIYEKIEQWEEVQSTDTVSFQKL